jgi:hypothetical protein
MNLINSLTPNTLLGWVGAGLLLGTAFYHKRLTEFGLIAGLAVGFYLYFVVDQTTTTVGA